MRKYLRSHWWVTLFIFFFPLIVIYGYVDFIRSSELNARLGWLVMVGGLAYLFRKTLSQKLLLGVLAMMALSGAFDILYAVTFGGIFTSASFDAMMQTDLHEGIEFLLAYASVENVFLFLFYLSVVYWSLRQVNFKSVETKKERFYVILGVLMVAVAIQQVYQRDRFFDTIPGFVGVGLDFTNNRASLDEDIASRQALFSNKQFSAHKLSEAPQTYVVVIGESMNRNHLNVYGYPRETTPSLLKNADDILLFENVVSAFAQTRPSLSATLTEASSDQNLPESKAISLLGAVKKAGFKTWWISNQQPLRKPTTALASLADETHFISHDFHGVENNRYDGYLLPYVKQAVEDKSKHKVIFVHLMGSHLQYRNRYPESFSVFQGTDGTRPYDQDLSSSQVRYINEYDNSVRYTDYMLGEIIGLLKGESQITAMSFFADHGEEVFDSKDFKGHGPDGVTKNMLEIPFLLWRNEAFKTAFPEMDAQFGKQKNAPFMLDDFFHFGLCMMHVESDLLIPERAMCSDDFKPKPRIVYGKDYDKEIR